MFEGLADQAAQDQENTAQSDSQSQPTQDAQGLETQPEQTTKAQELMDLQKLEKFRFEGQEMTYEDLKKAYLRHSDYTKKTQALAEEKKFNDNLRYDLATVKRNPNLAAEFKKTYPERFHAYLDVILDQAQQAQGAQLPPEVLEKLNQHDQLLNTFQQERYEAESAKINNMLEQMEQKFTKKYPNAELGSVYHALETHVKKMREENPDYGMKDLNEKVIEGFYKSTNDYFNKRFTEWQQSQLKSIRDKNKLGQDIPPGGGVPTEAPQKMRLKDVADHIVTSEFN